MAVKNPNILRREPSREIPKAWQEDIRRAVEVMRRGGVILYPTDTVWGLGCDATNAEAVARVYAIKQRSDAKALITLVDSEARVQLYVQRVPEVAWDLLDVADKPLTIVFPGAKNLAPNLLAEDGSVGIRITREPFSRELCFRMNKAVVSTSANVSGMPAATCFDAIDPTLLDSVDYVCTSRRGEKKPVRPSSVIRLGADGEIEILRA